MTKFDDAHSEIMQLTREHRFDEAIRKCEEHLLTWPTTERHDAFHNLAYVRYVSGDLPAALAAISDAISLSPSYAGHRHARARWALELQDYDTAESDATELLSIEKNRRSIAFVNSALVMRAFALAKQGKPGDALKDLERVNDEGPFRICRTLWMKWQLVALATSALRERK
jgi:tetratricopeptide (TPR) repeat protein